MKTLNGFLNELAPIGKLERPATVIATDSTIHKLVRDGIKKYGKNADLNYIDVSQVTDMESLFNKPDFRNFNGDVSDWKVSNVTNMKQMFADCKKFNCPLDNWVVSNVKNMEGMFWGCSKFNQSLNNWNVEKDAYAYTYTIFVGCPLIFNPPSWYIPKN